MVRYRGKALDAYRTPRSGLSYAPQLDWALAAQWWHYELEAFYALDGDEQAYLVAVYRAKHQMDAVVAHEQYKEATRASKRK